MNINELDLPWNMARVNNHQSHLEVTNWVVARWMILTSQYLIWSLIKASQG